MKHNKLVRDLIPEIITANGDVPITHIATDDEYLEQLRKKLQEETDEFLEESSVEELADILEVVYALAKTLQFNQEKLEDFRRKKAEERGGFEERIILDETK